MTSVLTGAVPSAITPGPLEELVGIQVAEAATPRCDSVRLRPTNIVVDGARQSVHVPVYTGGPYFVQGSASCILRIGDSNAAVTFLQKNLNFCYLANLTVDGNYGPRTRSAVIKAQKQMGVPADGVWGRRSTLASRWDTRAGCPSFSKLVPGY